MKKLIPLIAIVLAMAVPAVMSAQTPDYYGYENPDKTVLIEWIEDAINDGDITFNPERAKDAFLALVEDLYDYRDAENWSACVTTAGSLEAASANIVGTSRRDFVAYLCNLVGFSYAHPEATLVLTPEQVADIQDGLVDVPPDSIPEPATHHVEGDDDPFNCFSWEGTDGSHHLGECGWVIFIPLE